MWLLIRDKKRNLKILIKTYSLTIDKRIWFLQNVFDVNALLIRAFTVITV